MKRRAFFCLCLCLCFLFSACGMHVPEQSSEPAESSEASSVPAPEDENARLARAYLDELLMREWEASSERFENVEWLSPEQVEAIRDCVKQMKAPILTEGDVLRVAEQALTVATLLWQGFRSLELPDCGVIAGITWSPALSSRSFEDCYRALLGYTLYLFTPPDYLFREDEVGFTLTAGELWLYLPLAPLTGMYTTRAEALSLLKEVKNGVQISLYSLADGEHLLDFNRCGTPVLMIAQGGSLSLDLHDLVVKGAGDLAFSEEFRALYAEAYVQLWLNRIGSPSISFVGTYQRYRFPDGSFGNAYLPIAPEDAQKIRDAVELLPAPVLTEETLSTLTLNLFFQIAPDDTVLLPVAYGDIILRPWEGGLSLNVYQIAAYFVELFTPSAYRFDGFLYALQGDYETPEEAMQAFSEGRTRFVQVSGGYLCFIDREGNTELPAEEPTVEMPDVESEPWVGGYWNA